MTHTEIIQQAREQYGYTPGAIAAFVFGESPAWYWDLESIEDEIWTLNLIQVMRLCSLIHVTPMALLPAENDPASSPLPVPADHDYPKRDFADGIIPEIRSLIKDMALLSDALGCYEEGLVKWLEDDCKFGLFPLTPLYDLCTYLELNLTDVLAAYWIELGHEC